MRTLKGNGLTKTAFSKKTIFWGALFNIWNVVNWFVKKTVHEGFQDATMFRIGHNGKNCVLTKMFFHGLQETE